MVRPVIILSLTFLIACNKQERQYEKIINLMTNAEVQYKKSGKIVSLSKQEINGMKKVFTRNVKPELQSDFIYDVRIDLFRDSTKLAYFLIYLGSEKPYANFYSDRLNFGFRLTYSIGMFLDESQ